MTFTKRLTSDNTERRMITLTENAKLKTILWSAVLLMYIADSVTDIFSSVRFIMYTATGIALIVFAYYFTLRQKYAVEKDDEMSSAHRTKASGICLGILVAAASVIFVIFQVFDLSFTVDRSNIANLFMFIFCGRCIIENIAFIVLEKGSAADDDEDEE